MNTISLAEYQQLIDPSFQDPDVLIVGQKFLSGFPRDPLPVDAEMGDTVHYYEVTEVRNIGGYDSKLIEATIV